MTFQDSKKLTISDRVQIWAESPDACTGSVIETGCNAVKVEWDDGQIGIIHRNGLANVSTHHGGKIVPVLMGAA